MSNSKEHLISVLVALLPFAFCAGYLACSLQNGMLSSTADQSAFQASSTQESQSSSKELCLVKDGELSRVLPGNPNVAQNGIVRQVACWGDSLTKGVGASYAVIPLQDGSIFDASYMSYPDVLNKMTGYVVYNYGVSGATSNEIVAMQCNLPGVSYEEEIQEDVDSVLKISSYHQGDILVIEMGSNGGWNGDIETLLAQYDTILSLSGCSDYLILGDTDDPGTSIGDFTQEYFYYGEGPGETAWEAALRERYGQHFVNVRVFLIEHGLEVAGITPTEEDEWDAECGCISAQLRDDWTHLNSYGYYGKALAVYQAGQRLGYWGAPLDKQNEDDPEQVDGEAE